MSKVLIDKIKERRRCEVVVGTMTFIARRPTDVEMIELNRSSNFATLGAQYVQGWKGVTENDVIGGGGTEPVAFDPLLWSEMWADRPDLWEPISSAIIEAYKAHSLAQEAVSKNSLPG